MKRVMFIFLFALVFALSTSAQGIAVGSAIENFSLHDMSGKTQTLNELKGSKGALIVFLSAQCPTVKAYNDKINLIAADYAAKGINFIGINSNATESLDWVKSDAAAVGYKFPVLIDKGNVIADKLGAGFTPEVYFVDEKNILVYHGAIDNDRFNRGNVTEPYLRTAFEARLAGKKVERTAVPAFGCDIKRAKATAAQ